MRKEDGKAGRTAAGKPATATAKQKHWPSGGKRKGQPFWNGCWTARWFYYLGVRAGSPCSEDHADTRGPPGGVRGILLPA